MKKETYYILIVDTDTHKKISVSGYKIDDNTMIYSTNYRQWLLFDVPTGIPLLDRCAETRKEGVKQYYDNYQQMEKIRATELYKKSVEDFNKAPFLFPIF